MTFPLTVLGGIMGKNTRMEFNPPTRTTKCALSLQSHVVYRQTWFLTARALEQLLIAAANYALSRVQFLNMSWLCQLLLLECCNSRQLTS